MGEIAEIFLGYVVGTAVYLCLRNRLIAKLEL